MKTNLLFFVLFACSIQLNDSRDAVSNSTLSGNQHGAIFAVSKDIVYVMGDQGEFLKTLNGGTTLDQTAHREHQFIFRPGFHRQRSGYAVGMLAHSPDKKRRLNWSSCLQEPTGIYFRYLSNRP